MEKGKGRKRFLFFCVAPAVLLFTVFMVIPTLNVFRMSLFRRSAYSPTEDVYKRQSMFRTPSCAC